jgi:hypothetical protein
VTRPPLSAGHAAPYFGGDNPNAANRDRDFKQFNHARPECPTRT